MSKFFNLLFLCCTFQVAYSAEEISSLVSADFESSFSRFFSGFSANYWGGATYEASQSNQKYEGTYSQRFQVKNFGTGDVHLVYPFAFKRGSVYRVSFYAKADKAISVNAHLRRDVSPWDNFANQNISLSTNWQRIELSGTYSFPEVGSFRLKLGSAGVNVYIDSLKIQEVILSDVKPMDIPTTMNNSVVYREVFKSNFNHDETPFIHGAFAPGWYWEKDSSGTEILMSPETRPTHVYEGYSSQKLTVSSSTNSGTAEFRTGSGYTFKPFTKYRAKVMMRADLPTTVRLYFRRQAHPWDYYGAVTADLTTSWKEIQVDGYTDGLLVDGVKQNAFLRVNIGNYNQSVYMDKFVLYEVDDNPVASQATSTIPDTLFGIHVLNFDTHWTFPDINHRVMRMWDTSTNWNTLETSKGNWTWNNTTLTGGRRLDEYINFVNRNNSNVSLLFTLGQTPTWASKTPSISGLYGYGSSGAPTNLSDWNNYVRTLAVRNRDRYGNLIKYWEVWNEPDYIGFYRGTVPELVTMSCEAKRILKEIDPNATIISPGVTSSVGVKYIADYVKAGGASCVDKIGYHHYYQRDPEILFWFTDVIRKVLKDHGVDKKLYHTEGSSNSCKSTGCGPTLSVTDERSLTARALLVLASQGVENFNYYITQKIGDAGLVVENGDWKTPNDEGIGYRTAVKWLKGNKVLESYRISKDIYVVKLERLGNVIWTSGNRKLVRLPQAWKITKAINLVEETRAVPASGEMLIGKEPLLLQR